MTSVGDLVTALNGLQYDAANREKYNQWLQQFQRNVGAWEVTYEVLAEPGQPRDLKIFCAQTLRKKIGQDLHQVPHERRLVLKDQVLALLEQNSELLNVVGVQLCVALAAFAMQVVEWESPIHELVARFDTPRTVPLLFEFLRVLPEEFDTTRPTLVDPVVREQRAVELVQKNAPLVLDFMIQRAQMVDQQRSLFFQALNPWLREVGIDVTVESPLLDAMFAYLGDDEAREAAADCICTVLHETDEVQEETVQSAIAKLLPRIMQLPVRFSEQYADNPELHRDITRILSKACEDWHMLILMRPEQFRPLVAVISQCITVPDVDLEVVEYTFAFFEEVRIMLERPNGAESFDLNPLRPIFVQLLSTFQEFLEYPEHGFGSNKEAEEKFKDFRYDVGSAIKACCLVTGADSALGTCTEKLALLVHNKSEQEKLASWRQIEGIFMCMRLMARVVPVTNTVLPQVLQLLEELPRNQEQVQHAAVLFLGRYSQWACQHERYVPFAIEYIMMAIRAPFVEVRRGASHAFLYFATDCARPLVRFLPALVTFYAQNIVGSDLDRDSVGKIADGIGAIVDESNNEEVAPFIDTLFELASQHIRAFLDSADAQESTSVQLANEIEGLAGFVAMVHTQGTVAENHPLAAAVQRLHPMILELMQSPKSNRDIVGTAARYLHHVFYNCGRALSYEAIGQTMQVTASVLVVHPLCSKLYEVALTIVSNINPSQWEECGVDSAQAAPLFQLVWQFSKTVSQVFGETAPQIGAQAKSTQGTEDSQFSDLATLSEGFYFWSALLANYTEQFVSTMLRPVINLCLHVLHTHDDQDVLVSVLYFFGDLITFGSESASETSNSSIQQTVNAALESSGEQLVNELVSWYVWRYDQDVASRAQVALDLIARLFPGHFFNWLKGVVDQLPEGSVSEEEKFQFLRRVVETMSQQRFDLVGRLVDDFADGFAARHITPR